MSQTLAMRPIPQGFDFTFRIRLEDSEPIFPNGCRLRSQIRPFLGSPDVVADLATEGGGISIIDSATIEIHLTAEQTARMIYNSAVIDFVRTDLQPELYLDVFAELPVRNTVTESR